MEKKTIILVEDNKLVADVATYVLNNHGFSVFVCNNLPEAVETINKVESLDLLFTDVLLPDRRLGTEIAEIARSKAPDLPILLTSGYTGGKIPQELLQQKHVIFLQKPYKAAQLLKAVDELLHGVAQQE